ncbi:hypothetical protein cym2001_30230 [Pseudomonas sp. CYM-20-01]|nr:hypothetical protein cym2001_30230 [Pseudomonas sp. CYM-20-01]
MSGFRRVIHRLEDAEKEGADHWYRISWSDPFFFLKSNPKSNPDARRFYQAFGFQVMGEIPFKTDLAEIGMDVMGFDLKRLGQ